MAFTFQINTDIEFIHDENLLQKAEANKPLIRTEQIRPSRIVDLIHDENRLN